MKDIHISRASYVFDIIEDFLFITDLNEPGTLSVTMDIENVILEIYKNVGDEIKNIKIIYQDSEGVWDGVLFNICVDQVRVKEFVILGKENVEDAVEAYLADPRANPIEEPKAKKENYLFDVE
jgi:hypothetical protein